MNNIPVSAYNPTQRERFRRRLLLFYSVHDPEGSGRVSNALILKIPEAMVMSGLYSKYNVGFEEEERIARQKGLLPEQQQHFNAMEMINNNNNNNNNNNSNNNNSAPPTVVTGGEFENNVLNSFATGSAHDLSGMMADVVNSDNSGNNLRHRASTVSNNNNNNNNNLFLPSDQNNQNHPQDFGPMQQSVSNFSAQPSFAVGKDQANISGTNLVGNSADTPTPHQNNNNNNNNNSTSPFVFRTNEVTPVTPQRPSLRRDSVAAGSGSGSGGGSAGTPSGNSAFPSLPQQQQQQQQSSSTSSYPEVSVNSLPETEKQRVQKRVDRFYKRYFPEGAWKAQEARSSHMTESDLFESLCSSYKVSMAEERVLAAELLPDSQKGKSDSNNNNSPVTSAAAAESIRQWYEEQLKKLETQHKQELFEEKEQRWKLEQENERVTKEKLQESKKSAEVREKLQVDLLDAKKAILEKERERDRLLEQQQKLIRESQTSAVVVEKEMHETREIGLCTTASLGGRSSTATSVGGDAGGGLEFGIRSRSDSLIGNNFSDNSNNKPSPSSATAIEAQLIFLKNELAAAKNYSESLDRVHKAEMEEKESELILRLQEKAALERRLSEESQLSPSRRNLLYEKGGNDNQGNSNNNHSKTLVGEDEDLPPDSPPPPLRSSSSSPPSPLSRQGNKTVDPNNNNNTDSNHKIVDDGNISGNNFHVSPSERRHRDRLEKLQQRKMGLHYMNNNNNHNSPSRAFTVMATLSASSTISTPASPVRVKGHASPEHPLLMVCGICGEQGRDRFCHNCGANYYDGEEIILQ